MPKPVIIPTWASDANYPAGAEPEAGTPTKVAPTTGQGTIGWRPDQIPTAQEQNWWMDLVADWLAYLDGANIDGDLTVTGNLLVTNNGVFDGSVYVATNQNFNMSGTGVVIHGEYKISDSAAHRFIIGASGLVVTQGSAPTVFVTAGNTANFHGPTLQSGYRCLKMKLTGVGTGASTAPTITVGRMNSDGTVTNMPVTTVLAGSHTSAWEYTMTVTTPLTIGEGAVPVVTYMAAGATASVYTVTTRYDRIA